MVTSSCIVPSIRLPSMVVSVWLCACSLVSRGLPRTELCVGMSVGWVQQSLKFTSHNGYFVLKRALNPKDCCPRYSKSFVR